MRRSLRKPAACPAKYRRRVTPARRAAQQHAARQRAFNVIPLTALHMRAILSSKGLAQSNPGEQQRNNNQQQQ
jgi:hypothetical protein